MAEVVTSPVHGIADDIEAQGFVVDLYSLDGPQDRAEKVVVQNIAFEACSHQRPLHAGAFMDHRGPGLCRK